MKWRFVAASASPLFTGKCRTSISKAVSINPNFIYHFQGQGYNNRHLPQGFESFHQGFHSSSREKDDDFLELGPVVPRLSQLPKLSTEKHDTILKNDPGRKAKGCRAPHEEMTSSLRELFLNVDKTSHNHPSNRYRNNGCSVSGSNLKNSSTTSIEHVPSVDASTSKTISVENVTSVVTKTSNTISVENVPSAVRKTSNTISVENVPSVVTKTSNTIYIENVPSVVNLSQVIEAVSSFGKVACASMRNVPNGLDCCDVTFEDEKASKRAISVGEISLRKLRLPIRGNYFPESVIIRITDISKDTDYATIQSVCKKFGALEGMAREREGTVDVIFKLKDHSEIQKLLKALNYTVVDKCQWSAYLQPKPSPGAVSNSDYNHELSLQFINHLIELKTEFSLKKVCLEDFEAMHFAIMHLEEHPSV